ncbi:MAG: T9SS type A sorting domain-containing protein [Bacteroidetes bacterium]|nr:T9SS type A sorting domain-containing protein [Bacteroidota bacterium]
MKSFAFLPIIYCLLISSYTFGQYNDYNHDGFLDFNSAIETDDYLAIRDTGDVIHTIPAPGSYCNTIAWDGEAIWVSDIIYDSLYRISYEDGAVLQSFPYPPGIDCIEGLDYSGGYLWATSWEDPSGLNSKILKFNPANGELLDSFDYPADPQWPHGIAHDGHYLWVNNFLYQEINSLDKIDPETGELISSIPATADVSVGIEYIGNSLWVTTKTPNKIQRLNPTTGEIIWEMYAPCSNPRGLSWDGAYLWTINRENATLYQLDIGPASVDEPGYEADISIYPNPSTGPVDIHIRSISPAETDLLLINTSGQQVGKLSGQKLIQGKNTIHWDLSPLDLATGLYILELRSGSVVSSHRIMVCK